MAEASIHGIEFEIKGNAASASDSLDRLATNLTKIKAAASGGLGLSKVTSELKSLSRAFENTNFLSLTLYVSALKKLGNIRISNRLANGISRITHSLKGLNGIGINSLAKITDALKEFGGDKFNAESLEPLKKFLKDIAAIDFSNLKGAADAVARLKKSAGVGSAMESTQNGVKSIGEEAKKQSPKLNDFMNSVFRIVKYRLIRSAIKIVTAAFSEGLKNAYMFDKAAGGGLADALDNLATKSLTLKNQLGAAFGGLLTAITPVAIQIIKIVTALASAITRLIAILGGNSQWLKAKDVWTEWGDAAEGAGGAAKEALKYLAPFDELNVLPSQRSGGGGGGGDNYGDMFEWVDTDVGSGFLDSITGAFSKLADWFQSKDWQDIGAQAWQTLKDIFTDGTAANEAVTSFMEALGSAFGAIVGTAWGFIHDLVEDLAIQFKRNLIDYNGDGKITAVDFLKAVLKTGGDIADWVYETLVKPFFDGFGRALTGDSSFDFTNWAKENFLNPIIRAWNTFTQNMLNPFIEAINSAIDYINNQFNTNIPHIPLIGEVAELEVKVPNKDRKIPNGMMTVKEFEDKVPSANKNVKNVTATATKFGDNVPDKNKILNQFKASFVGFNDNGIANAKRKLDNFKAELTQTDYSGISEAKRRMRATAVMKSVDASDLDETKRNIRTNAVMKSVNTADLTNEQRRIRATANMQNVRTTDLKDEARRIRTTANLQGAVNNIPKAQLSLASTAEVKAKVIKPSLQDPYTGNLQLDATAHISRVTGQTSIDMYTKANGGVFSGGFWKNIPQFAKGGSLFVAGEAGPEIVGHIGGRTEVLNRSQLASTMYAAVRSAMAGIGTRLSNVATGDYTVDGDNEEVMYRAMSRALADSDLGGDIELDGDVLYKRMVNRNRANTRLTGVNAMA